MPDNATPADTRPYCPLCGQRFDALCDCVTTEAHA